MKVVKDIASLQFYKLNEAYRLLRDEASSVEKDILDLDILKLKKERRLLEIKEKLRIIESEILIDLQRFK